MIYVVDSNFFIQAHRSTYPLDVATGFWKVVSQLASKGKVISIDKVQKELYEKNDALEDWCKNTLPESFFHSSQSVLPSYIEIVNWSSSRTPAYSQIALDDFMDADNADAYLLAFTHAIQEGRCLVTQEVSAPKGTKSVKIPDCAMAMGLRCMNTIEMFREMGVTF